MDMEKQKFLNFEKFTSFENILDCKATYVRNTIQIGQTPVICFGWWNFTYLLQLQS